MTEATHAIRHPSSRISSAHRRYQFRSYIPLTRSYKWRRAKGLLIRRQKALGQLEVVLSSALFDQPRLRRIVTKHMSKIVSRWNIGDYVYIMVVGAFLIMLLSTVLGMTTYIASFVMTRPADAFVFWSDYALAVGGFYLGLVVLMVTFIVTIPILDYVKNNIVIMTVLIIMLLFPYASAYLSMNIITLYLLPKTAFILITGLTSTVILMSGMFFLLLCNFALGYISEQHQRRIYPDTVAIQHLILVLRAVMVESPRWEELAWKRKIILDLEVAANCIERYVVTQLHSGDPLTDEWTLSLTRRLGSELRSLKRWIISPLPDTHMHLRDRLGLFIVHIIVGEWGSIPCENVSTESISHRRITYLLSGLRTIVTGILPLLLFLIVQKTPFQIVGPLADVFPIAAIIWSLISLLIATDPLFAAKIAALKETVGLFPLPGQK